MPATENREPGTETASVIASFGRQYAIRMLVDDTDYLAVTRAKRTDACVGDRVDARRLGGTQAVIESIQPRHNLLCRSDRYRRKMLAANLDQVGIVLAGSPRFAEDLLLRVLLAAEAAEIDILIIANKADELDAHAAIAPRLTVLRELGYRVLEIAVRPEPARALEILAPALAGKTSILLGQSGMGKSSLINALVPDAQQATEIISQALGTGRHTTTYSRMFQLDSTQLPDTRIIDSPGFQTFGLAHLSASERVHAMPEYRARLGRCRFHSCTHRAEPGCAIRAAAQAGEIDSLRYRLFTELHERD